MFKGQFVPIVRASKEIARSQKVFDREIGSEAVIRLDQHMRRLRPCTDLIPDVRHGYARPRGVELGPLCDTVDVRCYRLARHCVDLVPIPRDGSIDEPIDGKVPCVEIDLRNTARLEDRKPLRVILAWREARYVDAKFLEFGAVAREEAHRRIVDAATVPDNVQVSHRLISSFVPYISCMDPFRRSRRLVVGFVAFAIVASACTSSSDTGDQTAAGDINQEAELAPDFMVPTASGGRFSLSGHLATDGRPVFLNLWASWCFPCREEMPAIDEASKRFTNVAFIGVAVQDSTSEANDFRQEIGVSYEIGFDEDGAVNADYRPLGLPASYIISSDGLILERVFGKLTEEDLAEKLTKYFG